MQTTGADTVEPSSSPRVALVLPPLTQVNTPYPGPAYLGRCLRDRGIPATQWDLGIELVLRLLSAPGLGQLFDRVAELAEGPAADQLPEPAWRALALRAQHVTAVEPVVAFLQGRDRTLASLLARRGSLPTGPRLERLEAADPHPHQLGADAQDDRARLRATRYIEDLVDLVTATVDPGFGLAQYQHHLAAAATTFDPLAQRLASTTLVDDWLDALVDAHLDACPELRMLGLSVPFPGTLYGALRIGARAKARGLTVVLGGGFVSTELREVDEDRLWDSVDALVYDDGEAPLLALIDRLEGHDPADRRVRTRTRDGLHDCAPALRPDLGKLTPAAWYGDLDLSAYLQLVDSTNPAHRLWGDGRWNKITLAHGCYWRRCAFCDLSLDYIRRFEPARIADLVDAMAGLVKATGQRGFHLVDEAAPPRLMRDLALALLDRGLVVSWWGNIRFERAFSPDLCRLLAASGLVMVTGGLEVASDRLLSRMDKGVTVDQAARAAQAFVTAGVRVHAYLMYGFPSQTTAETVDSMEIVRQMFAAGILDSAFWHRFVLTRHSAIYQEPQRFGVRIPPVEPGRFAANDLPHVDEEGDDPDLFEGLLEPPLAAWMAGKELATPVTDWLPFDAPEPNEPSDRIAAAVLATETVRSGRLLWLGGDSLETTDGLVIFGQQGPVELTGRADALTWLAELLDASRPGQPALSLAEAKTACPAGSKLRNRLLRTAREAGLLVV